MQDKNSFSKPTNRLTLLDALRGFALLGVILMHMLQQFSVLSFDAALRQPNFPVMDEAVQWIGQNIIMGRFINIFAFLFGLSFFIQMDRAALKGIDFRKRFIWRMIVMLFIGLIGNVFYAGEIISLYAIFGLLLVFLYRVKNSVLLVLVSLLLLGVPRAIQVGYTSLHKTERVQPTKKEQIDKSTFVQSVKHNFTSGLEGKLNYQFGLFGRGYITFGLFVLGLLVGRSRFFERSPSGTILQKYFVAFAAIGILFGLGAYLFPDLTYRSLVRGEAANVFSGLFVMTLHDLKVVASSGAIVMVFSYLYLHTRGTRFLAVFTAYGRMGLTNYQAQGVIGCFIFSMWAYGSYFETWGLTELFLLGIGIYIIQLLFSRQWLKYYLYGPLEWLLRSATYLKVQPLRVPNTAVPNTVYAILLVFLLCSIVGFTNGRCEKKEGSSNSLQAGLYNQAVSAQLLVGQGLAQVLNAPTEYQEMQLVNFQLAASSYFHWQSYTGGRRIIVTEGEGYFQSKGKAAIRIGKGDYVDVMPGLYHWIGSANTSPLHFISVSTKNAEELSLLHEEVSPEVYRIGGMPSS